MRHVILSAAIAASLSATAAHADVRLLAIGDFKNTADRSGLTGNLENGLAANVFGGIGSALAYAGGTTFLFAPDRGPNATPWNSAVDDTTSYISRFHTVDLTLKASTSGALPFSLTPVLQGTTLLSSPTALTYAAGAAPAQNTSGKYYFSGRSDNFGAGLSTNPANARFDPEGLRVSNDGNSVFVSDEYGPYVRQFDRRSGELIRTYALPGNLAISNLSSKGDTEIANNPTGRVANKGMEGLAITPDGKTLVGIMQAPLAQDASVNATKKMVRIVTIDIATGATHEYGYKLTNGSGVSEITAINDHEFLVDERDGKGLGDGSAAAVKQLFRIDLSGATDITNLNGAAAANASVGKTLFLDLVPSLSAALGGNTQVPSKIEGFTFGQDVVLNGETYHTLFIGNDNDFVPASAGPSRVFVYGFKDGDLPGLTAQSVAAIPEPDVWAMLLMGFGMAGTALRKRARRLTRV
ncbi:Phytase-like domain-containing protein [Sphingomonas antarctica]|uniref:esterase-like activity of phytase family protein n=1 Tax=Sphingomonas antarctica TaxID=2040274 RepID=UPI0039EA45CC